MRAVDDGDGAAREREGERAEKGRSTGESESGPGGCMASFGVVQGVGRSRRWPSVAACVRAHHGHTPSSPQA